MRRRDARAAASELSCIHQPHANWTTTAQRDQPVQGDRGARVAVVRRRHRRVDSREPVAARRRLEVAAVGVADDHRARCSSRSVDVVDAHDTRATSHAPARCAKPTRALPTVYAGAECGVAVVDVQLVRRTGPRSAALNPSTRRGSTRARRSACCAGTPGRREPAGTTAGGRPETNASANVALAGTCSSRARRIRARGRRPTRPRRRGAASCPRSCTSCGRRSRHRRRSPGRCRRVNSASLMRCRRGEQPLDADLVGVGVAGCEREIESGAGRADTRARRTSASRSPGHSWRRG